MGIHKGSTGIGPPRPFDHSFVRDLIELAQESEDNELVVPEKMEALGYCPTQKQLDNIHNIDI